MEDYTKLTQDLFHNLYPQFDLKIKSLDIIDKSDKKKIFVGVEIHKYGLDYSKISEKLSVFSNITYNVFQA